MKLKQEKEKDAVFLKKSKKIMFLAGQKLNWTFSKSGNPDIKPHKNKQEKEYKKLSTKLLFNIIGDIRRCRREHDSDE